MLCVYHVQQELMVPPRQTTNDLDPFLSCNVDHSRQESADSGLGLGNNYSLPHTPEDFLSSNMDDNMDCTSGKINTIEQFPKKNSYQPINIAPQRRSRDF